MPRTFGQAAGRFHWPFGAFRRARVKDRPGGPRYGEQRRPAQRTVNQ
jgi:hypothetical protein